jgi:hypothetical protein
MDLATRKMVYYGLLGLLMAGSTIAVFRVAPQVVPVQFLAKDGTFAVSFSSIPSDIQSNRSGSALAAQSLALNPPLRPIPVSVNVTIDSISFHDNEGNDSGWTTRSLSPSVTIDLLQPSSVAILIDRVQIPSQNVTMVVLHVSNVVASVSIAGALSTNIQASVPSNTFKIPVNSGARVDVQRTTAIVVGRPHIVVAGNGDMIKVTPVLIVDSISGPK